MHLSSAERSYIAALGTVAEGDIHVARFGAKREGTEEWRDALLVVRCQLQGHRNIDSTRILLFHGVPVDVRGEDLPPELGVPTIDPMVDDGTRSLADRIEDARVQLAGSWDENVAPGGGRDGTRADHQDELIHNAVFDAFGESVPVSIVDLAISPEVGSQRTSRAVRVTIELGDLPL